LVGYDLPNGNGWDFFLDAVTIDNKIFLTWREGTKAGIGNTPNPALNYDQN
jgi:hypothetical protein